MVTGRGAECINHTIIMRYHHALTHTHHEAVYCLVTQHLLPTGNQYQYSAFQGNTLPKSNTQPSKLSCPIGKYHTTYQCLLSTCKHRLTFQVILPNQHVTCQVLSPARKHHATFKALFHATFKPRSTRPTSLVPLDLLKNPSSIRCLGG